MLTSLGIDTIETPLKNEVMNTAIFCAVTVNSNIPPFSRRSFYSLWPTKTLIGVSTSNPAFCTLRI